MSDILLKMLLRLVGILVVTGIVSWVVSFTLTRWIRRLTRQTANGLDDVVLKAVRGPLIVAIITYGVQRALEGIETLPLFRNSLLETLFFLIYWSLGILVMSRLIAGVISWYNTDVAPKTETRVDDQVLPFIRRVLIIVVWIVAGIVFLSHFNVSSTAINATLTTLGVGSLAVALAAQATLSDTISGFVIMFDRPFRIGDRIELKELDTWGDVVDIGLRSTRILTRDNRLVVIPNSIIGKNLIVNHSIPTTVYRVQTQVSVAYGVDIDTVRQVLIDTVIQQDWVMKNRPVEALFLEFQDSGLLFRVRCWIEHYVETRRVIDKLNTTIYKALAEANIEIPFPQRVVHFQTGLQLNGAGSESFFTVEKSGQSKQ